VIESEGDRGTQAGAGRNRRCTQMDADGVSPAILEYPRSFACICGFPSDVFGNSLQNAGCSRGRQFSCLTAIALADTGYVRCPRFVSRPRPALMEIRSTRFGSIAAEPGDILHFPEGLVGFADCRDWVLLADGQNDALAWLQSVDRPELSLAVVSPRRFVPGYQMRVARGELEPLKLDRLRGARVLVIVGKTNRAVTLNLKAPLVINLDRRLGRQVIANGQLPLQYEVASASPTLKMTA